MTKNIKVIGPGEAETGISVYYALLKSANKVCDIIGEFLNWLNKNCKSNDEISEIVSNFAKKFNLTEIDEYCDMTDDNNVTSISQVYGKKNKKIRVYSEDFNYDGYELPLDIVLCYQPMVDEIKAIKKAKHLKDVQYEKIDFNEIIGKLATYYLDHISTKIIDAKDMILWVYDAGIDDWYDYELTIKDARIERVCDRKILSIFYTDKFDRSHQYIAEVCD